MVKKRGHLLDANVRVYKARSCLQQCGVDFDIKIMDFTSERARNSLLQ